VTKIEKIICFVAFQGIIILTTMWGTMYLLGVSSI